MQIFGVKPNVFLIFVEWFYRTMAREWNWIDRYRIDKFMMVQNKDKKYSSLLLALNIKPVLLFIQLCRRFLRKTLMTMSAQKWSPEMINGFLGIIRVYIFNHHPTTKFKKGMTSSTEMAVDCPVGLQSHFIDIYLEELSKSGADELTSQKILKFLAPFIEEMAENSDVRILNAIKERIFNHLMRQSDVGIDYQEGLMNGYPDEDGEDDMVSY